VAAGAVIETQAVIGRGAIIDIGVLVDHECEIGAFCHLRSGEALGPRARVPAAT
jgi:UDP-3-O-[3-hydroxymyristoyl] glucosamine N-acyltransferase